MDDSDVSSLASSVARAEGLGAYRPGTSIGVVLP